MAQVAKRDIGFLTKIFRNVILGVSRMRLNFWCFQFYVAHYNALLI